jgi:hypothetical protein
VWATAFLPCGATGPTGQDGWPRPRASALLAVLVTTAATIATGAQPAAAEYKNVTAQALAAHAEWLPYAPPPPNGPAAVCLVDTGVDLNPDTKPTVIDRVALDGGDPSDLSPSKHGTQMAMVMGAPLNGWGMVGFWPGVRIVSVRATGPGDQRIRFEAFRNGLDRCLKLARQDQIQVILLALGGEHPESQRDVDRFEDELSAADSAGVHVVVAAGNSGAAPEWPASDPRTYSVAAAAADRAPCPFSARGTDVDAWAPGCGLDAADVTTGGATNLDGTSAASAIVAAAFAAIRSYGSGLTKASAESAMSGTALDLETTFTRAGLSEFVSNGRVALAEMIRRQIAQSIRSLTPRLLFRRHPRRLLVRTMNRPKGAAVVLETPNRRRINSRVSSRFSVPNMRVARLCAYFELPSVARSRRTCVVLPH